MTEQKPMLFGMERSRLKERVLAGADNRPGVYRWLDRHGRTLYVGKSVRTRARLLSYFNDPRGDHRRGAGKRARLMREATGVAWDYVPNEFAAVFREMRLIRAWRPKYNVEHKRDRPLAFAKITNEPAPRIVATTRVADDGARYYGPFGGVRRLARATTDLARVLGLRDCPADTPVRFGGQLELFGTKRVPLCLRGSVGSCLAPCTGGCARTEYMRRVAAARAFLDGRGRQPLDVLTTAMAAAAKRMAFEEAGRMRDRLARLEDLRRRLSAFPGAGRRMNLVYGVPGFGGDDRLYLIRQGRLHSDLPMPKSAPDYRRAAESVADAFRPGAGDSRSGLDAGAAAEAMLAARWFWRRRRERRRALPPEKWLALAARNFETRAPR